jgi:hypothetical protein
VRTPLSILGFAIASLFAHHAFAQKDVPGEGRAVPTAKQADSPATVSTKTPTKAAASKPKAAPPAANKPKVEAAGKTPTAGSTPAKKDATTGGPAS